MLANANLFFKKQDNIQNNSFKDLLFWTSSGS